MLFITRRKLEKILNELEYYCDTANATGNLTGSKHDDAIWACGNASAVNYIRGKLKMRNKKYSFK